MKNKIHPFFHLLFLLVVCQLGACQTSKNINQKPYLDQSTAKDSISLLYEQSVKNAMTPDSTKIYKDLISIGPQSENLRRKTIDGEIYLLVVAWKSKKVKNNYPPIGSFYNTKKFDNGKFRSTENLS